MLLEGQNPHNKSIMVAVLGIPNVGKSSLINYLIGFDLSIVSNKPQTTRNQFHCTFTVDHTEVVLVDTPGMHISNKEFNKRINGQVEDGMEGADLNLFLIDLAQDVPTQFQFLKKKFEGPLKKSWVVFTKADLLAKNEKFDELIANYFKLMQEEMPALEKYFITSSKEGEGMHLLTGALMDEAQPGPHLYPSGDVSNKPERFFVTEYIREQAFDLLKEELPYETAVLIDEYKDFRDKNTKKSIDTYISASIIVNRPSQRAIVVGSKGSIIKQIGVEARKKIEAMIGGRIHLNLHVKVMPKWFKNNMVLEQIGLPRVHDSHRVWRKKEEPTTGVTHV